MFTVTPENVIFIVIAFEGPDVYSRAGGLGVRVAEYSQQLAELGFNVHTFFVGDPSLPGIEKQGNLTYYRWCQWISNYYPQGVYAGEEDKLRDFQKSLPPFVINNIIMPAIMHGKIPVIIGEEWHTAGTIINISNILYSRGLKPRCLLMWNANNTFSFWRINWAQLNFNATITTVSRYMKILMWKWGVNPMVIHNGIPKRLLTQPPKHLVGKIKNLTQKYLLISKIGRYDPAKRWIMAIEAVALLKRMGYHPLLLMRGGMEPHRQEVLATAWQKGLNVKELKLPRSSSEEILKQLDAVLHSDDNIDIIELNFFVPEELLRAIYQSSLGVLANSGHEPFGLVGLEVMASGGIAFTGATGEEYARDGYNAIVVETEDPAEIAVFLAHIYNNPEEGESLRKAGIETAKNFTWDKVLFSLFRKLEFIATLQGIE